MSQQQQQYYRGGSRSSQQKQQKREEFSGFEAFKNSSNNNNNQNSSRWNESVKNQWNDPQRYVQEVSKNYERNQSNDVFDKYKTKTISDRENDYTSKWRNNQLSPERIDPFASNKKSSTITTSNTTSSLNPSNQQQQSNKRTYNEIYEENKIEREKRNLLYQLKKANQQSSSFNSHSSSSSSFNNKNDNNLNDNNDQTLSSTNNINVGINFENSGILILQTNIVNQKGTILKWQSPPECKLTNLKWIIVEMKNEKSNPILLYKQKAWLLGRDQDVTDISLLNPSCSSQHAVICFRKIINNDKNRYVQSSLNNEQDIKPFIIDLKSTNGTFINGERIDDSRYYELKNNDILTFGQSSREFIILLNEQQEE